MENYSKVLGKPGNTDKIRELTALDMPQINTSKQVEQNNSGLEITKKDGVEYYSKKIKLNFSTDDDDDMKVKVEIDELRTKIKEKAQKSKSGRKFYIGHSTTSNLNKPGNILYKGDHLWVLVGDSKWRYLFLMTGNSEEEITFQFLRKLEDNDHYKKFCKEVTDKWKNYDKSAQKNWKDFLESDFNE